MKNPSRFKCAVAAIASCLAASAHAQTKPAAGPWAFSLSGATAVSTSYSPGTPGFDMGTRPVLGDDGAAGNFAFSADVPEGNYRVKVTFGEGTEATVLAESRRLMIEKVTGATEVSFVVNRRGPKLPALPNNAPGGTEVRIGKLDNPLTWDDKLTLWFTGKKPIVKQIVIEPADVPTIFLAGDSTVTDQPRDPGASWGQMLPAFFNGDIAVANHATSGETLKSFITGMRLDKILSLAKKGDYFLIQFGHNDEKQSWPQTYVEPATTYKAYLKVFISEARRRGMTPVLISPMERKSGISGNTHGGFPAAMREVAADENVAFIDNWANSKIMYAAMGDDVAAAFGDQTHHRDYGAYEIAKLVATGIRANKLDIARFLRGDFADLDPAKPDRLAGFVVPMGIRGL